MLHDLRDWLSFTFGLFSFFLTIWPLVQPRPPQTKNRLWVRRRTLQIGSWFKLTSHERYEDRQS
jgi:hypothetical protein